MLRDLESLLPPAHWPKLKRYRFMEKAPTQTACIRDWEHEDSKWLWDLPSSQIPLGEPSTPTVDLPGKVPSSPLTKVFAYCPLAKWTLLSKVAESQEDGCRDGKHWEWTQPNGGILKV